MNSLITGLVLLPSALCQGFKIPINADTPSVPVINDIQITTPCDIRITKVREQFLSCPEAQKLWHEIESAGSFTVECAKGEDMSGPAMVWVEKRQILLSEATETNEQMTSNLLFELNNLKNGKTLAWIGQNKCTSQFGLETYVLATETMEYDTAKQTHRISQNCFQNGFWPKDTVKYEEEFSGTSNNNDWTTYKGYLETQEKWGHMDFYRMHWYEKCKPEELPKWLAANKAKWDAVLAEVEQKKEL